MTPLSRVTRRAAAAALLGALLGAALAATAAAPASAHTPAVSATCSTLSVSLQSYAWSESNPRPNKVSVSIDGTGVASEWFGGSFSRDFSLGDAARAHTWRVVVDAVDNYDRTFEGTSTPCAPPTPKDAAATLHTTPATCTAGATLVLDGTANATWSTPTRTTGPGDYAVTATATKGHLFDDGKPTRSFTGSLAGPLGSEAPGCAPQTNPTPPNPTPPTPPRVTPDKPAPVSTSSRIETIDCTVSMITTTTTTVTTDWVLNGAGTEWVAAEPVTTSATSTRAVVPGDCPDVSDGGGSGGGTGGDGDGGGNGVGGDGAGGDGEGGIVGSVFEIGPEFGADGVVGSLARSGPEAAAAFFLSISLLAAGGIILLRHRQAAVSGEAQED